jgi:chaperonin GroES
MPIIANSLRAREIPGTGFAFACKRSQSLNRAHRSLISTAEAVMKLKPLGDRIVVRRTESSEKSRGGVYLPDNAKEKPQRGTVLAVGPGKMLKDGTRRALQVREGDRVVFTAWAGDEFKEKSTGETILVMHEEDVLAVVD